MKRVVRCFWKSNTSTFTTSRDRGDSKLVLPFFFLKFSSLRQVGLQTEVWSSCKVKKFSRVFLSPTWGHVFVCLRDLVFFADSVTRQSTDTKHRVLILCRPNCYCTTWLVLVGVPDTVFFLTCRYCRVRRWCQIVRTTHTPPTINPLLLHCHSVHKTHNSPVSVIRTGWYYRLSQTTWLVLYEFSLNVSMFRKR